MGLQSEEGQVGRVDSDESGMERVRRGGGFFFWLWIGGGGGGSGGG